MQFQATSTLSQGTILPQVTTDANLVIINGSIIAHYAIDTEHLQTTPKALKKEK